MRKNISHFEKVPLFYGVAYRKYDLDHTVCYPIPINWIVFWAMSLLYFIKRNGRNRTWWERREAELALKIREIEKINANKQVWTHAERFAEKIYQERFQKEWNRRIDLLMTIQNDKTKYR